MLLDDEGGSMCCHELPSQEPFHIVLPRQSGVSSVAMVAICSHFPHRLSYINLDIFLAYPSPGTTADTTMIVCFPIS